MGGGWVAGAAGSWPPGAKVIAAALRHKAII